MSHPDWAVWGAIPGFWGAIPGGFFCAIPMRCPVSLLVFRQEAYPDGLHGAAAVDPRAVDGGRDGGTGQAGLPRAVGQQDRAVSVVRCCAVTG